MARYLPKVKLILTLSGVLLLVLVLISACDLTDIIGGRETTELPGAAIVAPQENKVLAGSPVQIQSYHPGNNISRVELWVRGPGDETAQLVRSDVPTAGYVLQRWVPAQPGIYTIVVRSLNPQNERITELTRQIEAIISPAIGGVAAVEEFQPPTATAVAGPPFATPTVLFTTPIAPLVPGAQATPQIQIQVAQVEVLPSPTPTPPRLYPPPPPAPGVPPGPIESDPDYGPPSCDAAEYLGPYTASTARRIVIIEPDQAPAKVVAGTTVFRAWRLRNIGLCTWGPGYELAFYGGRSMGSGGVAFESAFPAEPPRRNVIVDNNRLIVPEGRPNEVAVLEVMLNTPATPGIHQSYWRMRNPAGVFFGPIIGVTLQVVRDCQFGIYGAPVINQFEIIGVGNVYRPENPVSVLAELGQSITLEYNIINATNFDIVFEDPTGNIQTISTTDPSGRVTFPASRVGRHVITLYADNGSCTATAQVIVEVIPAQGQQFNLDIILASNSPCAAASADKPNVATSSAVQTGNVTVQWQHFNRAVNQFTLIAQAYKRVYEEKCPVVESIFGWKGLCYNDWSDWRPVGQRLEIPISEGTEAPAGRATIANVERKLLNEASCDSTREQCGIQYVMRARIDGQPATPEYSNVIDLSCSPVSNLPTEIREAGSAFNP